MESQSPPSASIREVSITINGKAHRAETEARQSLSDFIRHTARLTGTHVGCEQGSCGACSVQLDGVPVRSCLILAVQADGREVRTIEALASSDTGATLRQAFSAHHGLQCGFCTPGILMTVEPLLAQGECSRDAIRAALSGNLCRCTGYQQIVDAVEAAIQASPPAT